MANEDSTPVAATQPQPADQTPVDTSAQQDQTNQQQQTPQPQEQQGATPNPAAQQATQPQGQQQGQQPAQQDDPKAPKVNLNPTGAAPQLPAPPAPANPSVQRAGILHQIAQTLAGGPRYKTNIDVNTGQTTRTPVPMSKTDIGMAIALEAISGSLAGLAQSGPAAIGKAGLAGLQQGQQIAQDRQQAQQREDQQAQADFQRQRQADQQNFVRAAATAQGNFITHQNAVRGAQMDVDFIKGQVADNAETLTNLQQVNAVKEQHVRGGDLLDKYHVTRDMAVPDGYAPVMGPDGKQVTNQDGSLKYETTYSVIDPEAQITIPKDTLAFLAAHHVPGTFNVVNGKTVPINLPDDARGRAKFVVSGLATAGAIKTTEAGINKQLQAVGDTADAKAFDVNLTQALDSGTVTPKALQAFARYSNLPLDQVRAAMEKDKVSPDIVGQISSLLPSDAVEKIKEQRTLAEDKAKKTLEANIDLQKQERLESVKSSNAYNTSYSHQRGMDAAKKADGVPLVKGTGGKEDGDLAPFTNDPDLTATLQDPSNLNTPNGTNEKFLQVLSKKDPARADFIRAYANGMDIQSYYAGAKRFGGSIGAYIHAYDPSFNASEMQAYDKTIKEMAPTGSLGKVSRYASAAIQHLHDLHDSIGLASTFGMSGDFKELLSLGSSEISNMYANGAKPNEPEIQAQVKALGSTNPLVARAAAVRAGKAAFIKLKADWDNVDGILPRGMKRPGIITQDAANALQQLTGDAVPNYMVKSGRWGSLANTASTQPGPKYTPPAGAFAGRDAQGNIVQYKLADGSIVDAKTGQPVTH